MKTWTWATALTAAALCGLVAMGGASAQTIASAAAHQTAAKTAKKATAKQPAKHLSTVTVTVTNSRPASLVELQAAVSGSTQMKKVLGFLKPGKQAVARLPRGENCQVDLHGAFDDGQTMDSSGVNVCADKTFNLTD